VLLDGVFNHVGRAFPAFQRVLTTGPDAAEAGWFRLNWESAFQTGMEPSYAMFEGHHGLVTLNHDEPAVTAYVTSVMTHWLGRGVDGWRLDAAYAVPRVFWRSVLDRVRTEFPEAYFYGEMIHGDYRKFVLETGMHAVTQYELWKAIWSCLNTRNFFELNWALQRHNGFLDTFTPLTFVGNHDVTRLASLLEDERHLALALAILFFCPGVPSVYSGDEQAFRGVKEMRKGGDDEIRPAFPATPEGLGSFGWPIFRLHQQLIALRRQYPWLHQARTRVAYLTNEHLNLESRSDHNRLMLALNVSDIVGILPAAGAHRVLCGSATLEGCSSADTRVRLPAHGWAIMEAPV
jgi:cyclomaltodextrinase